MITSKINSDRYLYSLDDHFKPFDLPSLLKQNKFSSYTHDFIPLSDPELKRMIDEHKMDLEIEKDGRIIYIPDKSDLEELKLLDEDDPLGL